ncbi:hypothetical protein ET445_02810 [Agromyces protaetiae]|uniref:BMP family ABC transporter substrate-binding protein n=1 Tax=Agromyces protaetiae TaxID=2509455 RepID=A0A4P6F8K9_9MICO|nr:hypothetical protein [Agromyces protaetiae]QAY72430.1 hypothetical protein ET445_02810 [Agromyces protaetiae]
MHRFPTAATRAATSVALVAALAGCSSAPLSGGIAAGVDPAFLGGGPMPTPEATIEPHPGSWETIDVPDDFSVIMIVADESAATTTIADAVEAWADRENVDLDTLTAANDDELIDRIAEATAAAPDVVIGAGAGVVDEFAYGTAGHLDQQYLVVGAQLGEPTENVTAAIWPGATFRGTGITDDEQDASAVTPARALDAVSAGVASILQGLTGIVVSLPA